MTTVLSTDLLNMLPRSAYIVPRSARTQAFAPRRLSNQISRRASQLRPASSGPARTISSLIPRFPHSDRFSPLFQVLDDYTEHIARQFDTAGPLSLSSTSTASFAPRFDVRETDEGYHLDGELPGIDQKDITIQFTGPQTLVIQGHTERSYSSGTPPPPSSDAASSTGEKSNSTAEVDSAATAGDAVEPAENKTGRYWVTERSIGDFTRTFNFPAPVDQDGVKARLRDGVLSVMVPKTAAPDTKRITIE
jgi:HSP20 family molecular chaperone IbpA